jgi:hypothetical protein
MGPRALWQLLGRSMIRTNHKILYVLFCYLSIHGIFIMTSESPQLDRKKRQFDQVDKVERKKRQFLDEQSQRKKRQFGTVVRGVRK